MLAKKKKKLVFYMHFLSSRLKILGLWSPVPKFGLGCTGP